MPIFIVYAAVIKLFCKRRLWLVVCINKIEMGIFIMDYDIYVDYTRELLSQMKINSYVIEAPYEWNDEYDGNLRKMIWNDEIFAKKKADFNKFLNTYDKDKTIFLVHDNFACDYIYIKLPDSDKMFSAGPFSFEKFTNSRILELCSINKIPAQLHEFMQLYYSALPTFADERFISGIINCMCNKFWDNFSLEKKKVIDKDFSEVIYKEETPEPTKQSIEALEKRYNDEALLMERISHGDYKAIEIQPHLSSADIKPRLADSIRDRKSLLIVLNTLCRKAAQMAYVHPVHLDEISRKFAIKIENCTTMSQLNALENDMTRKYCLLVQSYSLRTYSKPIQNIINYISFNLTADLSLNAIALEFSLNDSYLSTLFKKETGVTLTNYVNNKRIEHAIYLLNTTKLPIQDIAASCGINDVNYFTKLFKKLKGMTPTQYRKMVH